MATPGQEHEAQSKGPSLALLIPLAIVLQHVFIGETLPLMMLDLQSQMDISNVQVNLIRFVPGIAGLLIAPSAGALTDRWGSRRILVMGLLLVSVSCLAIALSNTIGQLMLAMPLLGIGSLSSTVTGYALLTRSATNNRQQAIFISAWGIAANVGYLVFPPLGGWVLVHSERGWTSIALLWMVSCLTLLGLALLRLPATTTSPAAQEPQPWAWLLSGGLIFSLTSSIPVVDTLLPEATGPLLLLDVALCVLFCWQSRHSVQARVQMSFLKNHAVILGLLALAGCSLVDWHYYSERFVSQRYLLTLNLTMAWLTPSNLSGLIGASLFGLISLRAGVAKTVLGGLIIWLLTPIIFLLTSTLTPVWIISGGIALYTLFEALVITGLQSSVTGMVSKQSLGAFVSLMTGLNMIFRSVGGAMTADVIMNTYERKMEFHLNRLPLSDHQTATLLRWLSEGRYHLVLENDYNIPAHIINRYLKRGTPPRFDTYLNCLHVLSLFCLLMILLVLVLYLASLFTRRRFQAQPPLPSSD